MGTLPGMTPEQAYAEIGNLAGQPKPDLGKIQELATQGMGTLREQERLQQPEDALLFAGLTDAWVSAELNAPATTITMRERWADLPAAMRALHPPERAERIGRLTRAKNALWAGYTALNGAIGANPGSEHDPRIRFAQGQKLGALGYIESSLGSELGKPLGSHHRALGLAEMMLAHMHLTLAQEEFRQAGSPLGLAEVLARDGLVRAVHPDLGGLDGARKLFGQVKDQLGNGELLGMKLWPDQIKQIGGLVARAAGYVPRFGAKPYQGMEKTPYGGDVTAPSPLPSRYAPAAPYEAA